MEEDVSLKKLYALFKFQLNIALDNKFNLIFSLLFPIVGMVMTIVERTEASNSLKLDYDMMLPYISYIIVLSMLFGWIGTISQLRENGFFKMFTSLSGSKYYIILVNFLINLLLNFCQVNILVGIYFLIVRNYSLMLLFQWNMVIFPCSIFCFLSLSFLLLIPLKYETLQIVLTTYLVLGMYLLHINFSPIVQFFKFLNLFAMNIEIGQLIISPSNNYVLLYMLLLCIIGLLSISRISVFPHKNRG